MITRTVRSLNAFIGAVVSIRNQWTRAVGKYFDPWFRGHRDAEWPLIPTLYRHDLAADEQDIRQGFRRLGIQFVSEYQPDEWGWYFLMQHFAAPTRLLDWTDGALIALLFAVAPVNPAVSEVTSDAAVWMLDPWWLNLQVLDLDTIVLPESGLADEYLCKVVDEMPHRSPELPIAIAPAHIARRIAAQRSRFTIFGTAADGLERVGAGRGSRLAKIVVERLAIRAIRNDLTTLGITETTVFPDLEGVSRELIRSYREPWEIRPGFWTR